MYHSFHTRQRQKGSYFLPFLSLIILGLIVVLVFQIVDYFQEKRTQALENKAAVKIISGRAEMKIWGVDQWTSALSGSILHEGDVIRTMPGSRAILSLLNGSVIRLNADTEVELSGLKSKDGQDNASFALRNGEIWLKRSEKDTVRADFRVATSHLEISSLGTVFNVSKGEREEVRVLDGRVQATINVEESESSEMRAADTFEIALGQEVSIGAREISDLQNRKPLSLVALLADDFRSSEWYSWNRGQDSSGGDGVTVEDAVAQTTGTPTPVLTTEIETEPVQVQTVLPPPEIVSPNENERTIRSSSVLISGTVDRNTKQIEVTTYFGGKPEPYVLQKYIPGSDKWTYVVSREYGNLLSGPNRFSIVAIDAEGRRSEPTEITIVYDKPREQADLSAPRITSWNGPSIETSEDSVKVSGSIGKGIVRIFVNDFSLTRYVPDSNLWTYYARTVYGNLIIGENNYEVYGVDADGNKTPVTRFKIIKRAAENPPQAATQSPQNSQQNQQPSPQTPVAPSQPQPAARSDVPL